mgnify:CR=1 FL=1
MSVRTKIRKVLDARKDIDGTEDASNCNMVGWTTHYVSSFTNPTDAYNNYSNYFMSGLLQPTKDGVLVNHTFNTAVVSSTPPAEVGIKHYKHQMQAMKSISFPDTMADDFPSNASSSLGVIGTDGYVNFSGTFTSVLTHPTGISMGELRGFEYHRNSDSIWPSSTQTGQQGQERLHNTLAIGIGEPTGGGTGTA